MAIDFDQIRKDNIVEYGKGVRHLSFLGRLYADKTHFIFELLQNAEDAGASKIKFCLFEDRLEVSHNGRVFNESDVKGICGVGETTKANDLTQIGKFGIGFKSVYAYTLMPEVHSDDNNFKIENFVRPFQIDKKEIIKPWTTLFVFPFASQETSKEEFQGQAFKQISSRLKKLGVRTLLFLRNLEEIEFEISKKEKGVYLREDEQREAFRRVTVIGQSFSKEYDEQWLVFSKPISGTEGALTTEVAFRITLNKDKKEEISRLKQSYLNVFFPTEKETHLGFLIQGPYRTTPARDNIPPDDKWNMKLVEETAILLQEAVSHLKQESLLNIRLLEALPIQSDDYPEEWMLWPLYNGIIDLFKNNDCLPTSDGGFVKASNAKLARGRGLRELISNTQLSDLLSSPYNKKWLAEGITQDRTLELRRYLLNSLDIEEIDPESFAKKVSYEFLQKQKTEWFIDFYGFLDEQEALWRESFVRMYNGPLRQKTIIRCRDGKNRRPYDAKDRPQVFLPVSSNVEVSVVHPTIYSDEKAQSFLHKLGISKPDICAKVINETLPYIDQDEFAEEIDFDDYQEQIALIEEAIQLEDSPMFSKLLKSLKTESWLLAENLATGEICFAPPSELYIPTSDLMLYFENNEDIRFVSRKITIDEELLLRCGARKTISIECQGLSKFRTHPRAEISLTSLHGYHINGLNCFDHQATVEGLNKSIETLNLDKAIYIWNSILIPLSHFIKGDIRIATRQDFSNGRIDKRYSSFGRIVSQNAWVPTVDGEFKKPSDCCVDELDPRLLRDDDLLRQLDVIPGKRAQREEAVSELKNTFVNQGFSSEIADIIIDNKDVFTSEFLNEALSIYKAKHEAKRPDFPEKKSNNPERRKRKIKAKHNLSDSKSYEKRERSVRSSATSIEPKIWLRDLYTNDDDIMVCQMCKNEMPFKLKDGSYYFEAVQVVDTVEKESYINYLALCPLCASKYRILVKNDADTLWSFINDIRLEEGESYDIDIDLGENGNHTIQFVETHLTDLKIVFKEQPALFMEPT